MTLRDGRSNRDKKLVYHLTALDNLPSIATHGLLSRAELVGRGIRPNDVADEEILARRGADLRARVPFHFIHKSPFDYRVFREHPETQFVLLAVRRSYARSRAWQIIPKHPLAHHETPEIMEWDAGFSRIDWRQIDKCPRDYDRDNECKLSCMAEALGPGIVSVEELASAFFETQNALDRAKKLNLGAAQRTVLPQMFPQRRELVR
jgi:hypothetical protein